jgi:2,3-bisphosphoglycerate-dependent phosphoglycerate mutase
MPPAALVLLRHGESEWNAADVFAGWLDVGLTERGRAEARRAGELMAAAGVAPDVVHTSVLSRATMTAELALEACDRSWVPIRRSWRLNERHYGALQGRAKPEVVEEHGSELVMRWRRSITTPPPALDASSLLAQAADPRFADVPAALHPSSESLADVGRRLLPYWHDAVVPDLRAHRTVCVTAHGNSLRVLIRHLDGLDDAAVRSLVVPTGIPLLYRLDEGMRPLERGGRRLGPEAATA